VTFKQQFLLSETWQRKALTINLFHTYMIAKRKKWNMRLTARYFNISLGHVCEDIKLANNMELFKGVKLRKDALKLVNS
jgi:hypothetical protein